MKKCWLLLSCALFTSLAVQATDNKGNEVETNSQPVSRVASGNHFSSENLSEEYLQATLNIKDLPNETLVQIFSCLDPKDLKHTANVCHLWEQLRTDSGVGTRVLLENEDCFNAFLKSSYKKTHIKFGFTPTPHQLEELVQTVPNLFSVDLSRTDITDVSALGGVHTLDLSHTNITDVSALVNLVNIECLHFH